MELDTKKMKKMMSSGAEHMEKCMENMKRGRPVLHKSGEMKTELYTSGSKEPMMTLAYGGDYKINMLEILAVVSAMAALFMLCRMHKRASIRREIKRHVKEEREKLEAKWEEKLQKEREKSQQ